VDKEVWIALIVVAAGGLIAFMLLRQGERERDRAGLSAAEQLIASETAAPTGQGAGRRDVAVAALGATGNILSFLGDVVQGSDSNAKAK
jgi:hypothetical protein